MYQFCVDCLSILVVFLSSENGQEVMDTRYFEPRLQNLTQILKYFYFEKIMFVNTEAHSHYVRDSPKFENISKDMTCIEKTCALISTLEKTGSPVTPSFKVLKVINSL